MDEEDKSIYDDDVREKLEEGDWISPEEEGFMLGYSDRDDEDEEEDDDEKEEEWISWRQSLADSARESV